jgi:hypothetical protein
MYLDRLRVFSFIWTQWIRRKISSPVVGLCMLDRGVGLLYAGCCAEKEIIMHSWVAVSLQVGYLRPELHGGSPLVWQQLLPVYQETFFLPGMWQVGSNWCSLCTIYAMLYFSHAHEHPIDLEVCCSTVMRRTLDLEHYFLQFLSFSPWDVLCRFFPLKMFSSSRFFIGVFFPWICGRIS